jgi:TM2 domain-containing membrane protein YozV
MKCTYCKNEIPDNAVYCPYCGTRVVGVSEVTMNNPTHRHVRKSGIVYFLLAFFFGGLGIHRFYVRDFKTGMIYLLGTLLMVIMVIPVLPSTSYIIPIIATIDGIVHISDERLREKFGKYWE